MIPSFDTLSLLALLAVTSASASDVRMIPRAASDSVVMPTEPDSNSVFKVGGQCTMSWLPDPSSSSKWKDMTIDLMTGSNLAMVKLANVASGLDGTDASTTSHTWTCPDVDPPAQIYFYQWTYGAEKDPQWSTRFLITAADGTSVSPPNATQPDGQAIGWGIGKLVGGTASGSGSDASGGDVTSTPSQPNGSSSGTGTDDTDSAALPSTTTAPSAATSATGLTNTSSGSSTPAASATAPSSAGRASIPALAMGGVAVMAAFIAQIVL